ncbi:MAG: HP0268 family nuclease [Sulfurimonas sp.]|uniref:HP0268 family nuclease n=1 Tax=Sulfurimonas sp. TaxID=2022749 RepID=UPI0026064FAE|nr:HP0268 family nuclease [Sulfurimonas sp.]MDD2651784.1 HP0268 family nuclease [Sulfurimonas sp.]MDD3451664.1 HP0268 family nuclease [Sulfurimonas sp.]
MDLKFARTELTAKPKKAELAKIEAAVEKDESVIFYFDRENSHKDLLELQDYFEAKGKSFYMTEVRYGLSDNEYMYQVHIIN